MERNRYDSKIVTSFFLLIALCSCWESYFRYMGSPLPDKIYALRSNDENPFVNGVGFRPEMEYMDTIIFNEKNLSLSILVFPECPIKDIEIGKPIHIQSLKTKKELDAKIFQFMQGQTGFYFLCVDVFVSNFWETEGKAINQIMSESAGSTAFFIHQKSRVKIAGMSRGEFIDFFSIEPKNVGSTVKMLHADFQDFENKIVDSINENTENESR